jgi:YesN/AraC family two-component response regulator
LTATDGAEALAVYSKHENEIDVVLTDVVMPVLDGTATIYALRQINPAIKIIAMSGLDANQSIVRVTGIGPKHFLMKPYTAEALLKTMRTVLEED